ncbi:UvrD-helicase domain-containing protein [Halarchaeum nitratireducens]|uniref:DNA 3'-5' helicase n=1 Tax=Halarchaeum nitratireducens TaxID=489913 RepID=A0A830GE29_9EURY|nr:UvrD-helicase domain-containing protein [Halarchaeum nitratireducens]GGN24911.1 ATP-dependent helicase/nuclease subunit A [Halarchaeum nitratireducens]
MVDFDQLEDAQKRAVLAYDRNYAVTAGAGSGKTTTFTSRYLELLEETETEPHSVAAITFTESGAAELQERVRDAVSDRLATTDGEAYAAWRDHHDALPEAYIHTIHGFCSRLLSEYALEVDVPVGFDVIEETGARGEQLDAVERFVDDHLDDPRLERLTELYYRDRLEELLSDLLAEHHRAREWANCWADTSPDAYAEYVGERFADVDVDRARDLLGRPAVQDALRDVQSVAAAESAGGNRLTIAGNVAAMVDTYGTSIDEMDDVAVHDAAATLCEALTSGGTAYYGAFDAWPYTGHDDWDNANAESYERATTTLTDVLPVEAWATGDRLAVERNAAPYYVALASLFCDLHESYQARKRREGVLDFEDLIDKATELLEDHPEVRADLQGEFDYVMLDEVQDTDPRQWELVQLLTSLDDDYDACNVFVVGDEKQSIFRFRGADVAQFARERRRLEDANNTRTLPSLEDLQPVDGDGGLDRNFRSLPGVLEPINGLFDDLFGDIPEEYQAVPTGVATDTSFEPAPQALTPNRSDEVAISTGATFVLVPEETETRQSALADDHALVDHPAEDVTLDARTLAAEVAAVLDDGTQRYETTGTDEDGAPVEEPTDLEPSDVAILLRKRTHLEEYERALAALNVPYTVASGIGFYERTEVVALRNLFAILADPRDDLALYGVLRSPLFGFEDRRIVPLWTDIDTDDLGEGALWEALGETDDERLADARDQLERWRRLAGVDDGEAVVETWDALLGEIIADTGFHASLATDDRGQQAVANVEKFRSRLRGWGEDGLQTLPAVLERIEREVDLSTREGEAEVPEDADGVRIMTVHDAKGREFPAVFVPGLATDFNLRPGYGDGTVEFETLADVAGDAQQPFVGIKGPDVTDPYAQTNTILKRRLEFARKRESVAEEKRILYVAMTRARDHLYLVGTTSTDDGDIAELDRGDAADPSNWYDLLAPLVFDDDAVDTLSERGRVTIGDEHPLDVRLPCDDTTLSRVDAHDPPRLERDVAAWERDREYSIAASYLGSLIEDGAPGEISVDHTGMYVSYSPPRDASDEDSGESEETDEYLPRNVFGSALHKAVELDVKAEEEVLCRLLEQFAAQEDVATTRVSDADVDELRRHYQVARDYLDGLDDAVVDDERTVRAELEHGEVYGDIDRLRVTDDAYHIVDYKTNKVTSEEAIDEKARGYAWQMRAYADALHQSDAERDVHATLLFTEAGVTREYEWQNSELDELMNTVDQRAFAALRGGS